MLQLQQRAGERAREEMRKRLAPPKRTASAPAPRTQREAIAALERQAAALERLQQSHDELERKVAVLQKQADASLMGLLDGVSGLQDKLKLAGATARVEQLTSVVNSAQSAAFGQRGSVFAPHNLVLAGNQLAWMFVDPFLRHTGLLKGSAPSLLTWLAPLGILATGHLALANRQHVRFISGFVTFPGRSGLLLEPLRDRIADSFWPQFQRRTDVPVTTTTVPQNGEEVIEAQVINGVLRIEMKFGRPNTRVAWMVDTGADVG